jgi:hypothetical protein
MRIIELFCRVQRAIVPSTLCNEILIKIESVSILEVDTKDNKLNESI